MTPVQLAIFLFALSLFILAFVAFGYGLGLAIRRHSRNDRRADRDDHVRAEEKGAALLRSWLSPGQAELWDSHRVFYVFGSDTGTCYRIKYGRAMNIDELDSRGRVVARWCFGPRGNLAVGDVLLAQKIALETMELEALAKANRNWISVPAC
jgi:hypothetical protein